MRPLTLIHRSSGEMWRIMIIFRKEAHIFCVILPGKLLYEETESDVSREALQQYMDILIGKIEDGDFPQTNAYVHNPAGEKTGCVL